MMIAIVTAPVVESAIESATRRNSRVFFAYIAMLVVTGLLIAFMTWLTWKAGNNVQDAVRHEADARIEEAKKTAAQADERSRSLEAANLVLREHVATLETQAAAAGTNVATLQKQASDAVIEQQHVQIELAAQQERAATAERSLLELQDKLKPRTVSEWQKLRFVLLTRGAKKGIVNIEAMSGNPESIAFANDLRTALIAGGWSVPPVEINLDTGPEAIGLTLHINSRLPLPHDPKDSTGYVIPPESPLFHVSLLQTALEAVGIAFSGVSVFNNTPGDNVEITVGTKPLKPN